VTLTNDKDCTNEVQVIYNAEQFNGLRIKLRQCCQVQVVQKRLLQTNADAIDVNAKKCKQTENLSALVFANGKIILTGSSDVNTLKTFAAHIYLAIKEL
jgi:TATA-box binding protein (TBP) (component of TFIID and TFIIIB)